MAVSGCGAAAQRPMDAVISALLPGAILRIPLWRGVSRGARPQGNETKLRSCKAAPCCCPTRWAALHMRGETKRRKANYWKTGLFNVGNWGGLSAKHPRG